MHELIVQIVRFVDGEFPGWVECELIDADGRRHVIVDKYPMFTAETLNADSEYPIRGTVSCEVLRRFQDEKGRELVQVSTARSASIESTDGLSEFVVPSALVVPDPS